MISDFFPGKGYINIWGEKGTPVISCERDRIRVEIATTRPFAGKIFVKGEYANKDCVRYYANGSPVAAQQESSETTMGAPTITDNSGANIENAESKDDEAPLDSSLWVGNEENVEEAALPLPRPEQAYRFTNGDEVLTKIAQNQKNVDEKIPIVKVTDLTGKEGSTSFISSSKWSGHGGASSTSLKPGSPYLGAFGGSHGESTTIKSEAERTTQGSVSKSETLTQRSSSTTSHLKIYQKLKADKDGQLKLEYPGPQGFLAENCPVTCAPCVCPSTDGPQERRRRNTNTVELSVPLGACNAKRDRKLSPPSLVVSFVAVISFHESFITKLDRAYHIQCAYTESNRSISTQIDVGMEAPTDLNNTVSPPICAYNIAGIDGKAIQNVRVGDRVKHEWTCKTSVPNVYTMLVHSCFVEDGAGQRYEVVDENGCSLDRYILNTPSYSSDGLTANVDAFMMKFPDRSSVDFQCAIKICSKLDGNCTLTPPDCSTKHTNQRRRRDTNAMDGESMTIHSNSLTVLDADIAQEIPEQLAYTSDPEMLPPEFCFSVAGFGILVSASTFLTTVAVGVAVANLYMRSQQRF
ncbi:unnamed protein product [Cylicocyclus nassatus]|uniref:ZP domain-containing protein n=1 Tax=Cylicocyclus nassatus TaxID=53992 RepID=A0AA36MDB9_CYLNA|nr:unnamed protein product [Cylicocyclus nassatus]